MAKKRGPAPSKQRSRALDDQADVSCESAARPTIMPAISDPHKGPIKLLCTVLALPFMCFPWIQIDGWCMIRRKPVSRSSVVLNIRSLFTVATGSGGEYIDSCLANESISDVQSSSVLARVCHNNRASKASCLERVREKWEMGDAVYTLRTRLPEQALWSQIHVPAHVLRRAILRC